MLARRTRLAFLDVDAALRALPRVIDIVASELFWDAARCDGEWRATVRFLRSMGLPEDRLAVTRDEVLRMAPCEDWEGGVSAGDGPHARELPAADGVLASEA